jgi:hypothetical protein
MPEVSQDLVEDAVAALRHFLGHYASAAAALQVLPFSCGNRDLDAERRADVLGAFGTSTPRVPDGVDGFPINSRGER